MARVILAIDEELEQEDEDPQEPSLDDPGVPPLKGPDPASLKPVDEEPSAEEPVLPAADMGLEGLPTFLGEEPEKYAGLQPKVKIWRALEEFPLPDIRITYRSLAGYESESTLSQLASDKAGIFWARTTQRAYLTAWDDMRNNWGRFLMDRIEKATILPRVT